jgi:hypothetical protein
MIFAMLTQEITGGNLRYAEFVHQPLRLRTFPHTRCSEKQHWARKKLNRLGEGVGHQDSQQYICFLKVLLQEKTQIRYFGPG